MALTASERRPLPFEGLPALFLLDLSLELVEIRPGLEGDDLDPPRLFRAGFLGVALGGAQGWDLGLRWLDFSQLSLGRLSLSLGLLESPNLPYPSLLPLNRLPTLAGVVTEILVIEGNPSLGISPLA